MSPHDSNDRRVLLGPPPAAPRGEYAPPPDGSWLTRERALVLVLMAATVLVFYLCYRLTVPFLPALAWALALAVMARPIHAWIARRFSQPDVAAVLAVAVVTLILVAPALLVGRQLAVEARVGAERVREQAEGGAWRRAMDENPSLAPALHWVEENVDVQREAEQAVRHVVGDVASLLSGSLWVGVQILLTLYILFFFFRDRHHALGAVRALVPLSQAETDEVFQRVADTIHATVNGTLMVAAIQGTMGGLMFWWLGLPAPVLWGVIMAVLAVVPYLGTFVVWLPTAAFLALQGEWGKAAILAAWGGVAIALIDNLLYPLLVGKQLRMHTLTAFVGIVGGIGLFGASGVILGPITVALAIALVDVWRRRTAGGRPAEAGVEEDYRPHPGGSSGVGGL